MLNKSIIARCASPDGNGGIIFDSVSFLFKLLLSDRFILDSIALKEIPFLLRICGYDEFVQLLKSDFLKFHCEAYSFGTSRQWDNKAVPQDHIKLVFIGTPDQNRKNCFSQFLNNIQKDFNLPLKKEIKLKELIVENSIPADNHALLEGADKVRNEVINNPALVAFSLSQYMSKTEGFPVNFKDITIDISSTDNFIKIIHNGTELLNVEDNNLRRIYSEKAILGACGMLFKLVKSQMMDSLTGFLDEEVDLFSNLYSYYIKKANISYNEDTLTRIISLPEFNFIPSNNLPIKSILKAKEDSDWQNFISFIENNANISEKELRSSLNGQLSRFLNIPHTLSGKSLRFVISTICGVNNPVIGTIVSFIDFLFTERLCKRNPVISFIDKHFQSIFKG